MPNNLTIRPATSEDYTSIAALWDEALLPTVDRDEWEVLIEGPAATVLLAEDQQGLAGAAVASFDGWRAYIYHVAVDPVSRRRGVGSALIREAESLLLQRGARAVYVMVHAANAGGIALTAAGGYTPHDCELIMTKTLPERETAPIGSARHRRGVGLFR